MESERTPDVGAIALGVASYVALAGWLIVLPVFVLFVAFLLGVPPAEYTSGGDTLYKTIIALIVLFISGYVTGRSSREPQVLSSALLGVVLYALVTLFNQLLWAAFGAQTAFD